MLIAPAGYGKTTLARQWLGSKRPHAWFGVPSGASDTAVFALGLAEAAAAIVPGCDSRLRERLSVTQDPESDVLILADILAEDLAEWNPAAWLVVDEYENVRGSEASESFIARVHLLSEFGLLIASRERPKWVKARDILYGSAFELSMTSLAMNHDEAAEVLGGADSRAGILSLADGWPAVIGLAAVSDLSDVADLDKAVLPDSLYAFLTEELFQRLDSEEQRLLIRIALAGGGNQDFLRQLLGSVGSVTNALEQGWLTWGPGRVTIDMHPLLRAFLRSRGPEAAIEASATVDLLIHVGHWDDAFDLIQAFELRGKIPALIQESLDQMLRDGRSATLKQWLLHAVSVGLDTRQGHLALASAELAFREGRFADSEVLALSAVVETGSARHNAEALLAAGRAAHGASREQEAIVHFKAARELATTDIQARVAALGQLCAATDLELPEAADLLAECEILWNDSSAERAVALTTRKLSLQARFGLPPSLDQARWAYSLIGEVRDPLSTTSFRNLVGYYLALAGFAGEAESVVATQRLEAERYRLEFVHAYADHIDALISVVRGDAERMLSAIMRLEAAACRTNDGFLLSNVIALRSRALVVSGAFTDAIECALEPPGMTTVGMRAEILATRALAFACAGEWADALAATKRAEQLSRTIEVKVLATATRAVVAIWRGDNDSLDLARLALSTAHDLMCLECFISTYRGFPRLGDILLRDAESRPAMQTILHAAGDLASGRFASPETSEGTWECLSPREREVLALVAAGLANREIASRLFIAEATVKVHVHHILEKLGVTSRTQAALRAPPRAAL